MIVYFWDCPRERDRKKSNIIFQFAYKGGLGVRQIGCIVNLGSACRGADEMFIFNFRHFPAAPAAAPAAGLGRETTTSLYDSFEDVSR